MDQLQVGNGLNRISVPAAGGHDRECKTLTDGQHGGSQASVELRTKSSPSPSSNPSSNSRNPPSVSRQQSGKLSAKEMVLTWRYVIVALLHFSFVVALQIRISMPMAMVCMVDTTNHDTAINRNGTSRNRTDSIISLKCPEEGADIGNNTTDSGLDLDREKYEFSWDSELQGLILTSNSFLTFCGPLLVDVTRRYIGNTWTMTFTNVLSTTLNLLTPLAARTSPYLLVAVRAGLGIVLFGNLTITGDTCAWWGPADEKQLMVSLIFAGVNVGGIIASSLSGLLCEIPYDNGWPFVFYVFGGMSLLWTIAWHFLSSQKPEEHRFISDKEKDYIVTHRTGMDIVDKNVRSENPPYKVILTSVPVLAFLFAGTCHVWSTNIFFTNLPFFFATALQSSVLETGLLMSFVSGLRFLGLAVWTSMVNIMVRRKMTITNVRKASICTGYFVAGVVQVTIAFLDKEHKWIIVGLLLFQMLNVCVGTTVVPVLPLDMAPRYAGFLTGLFFSVGTLVSISGPLLVSALTPTGTIDEWRRVWIMIAVVFFLASVVFGLFGDATLQSWAMEDPTNKTRVVSSLVQMGIRFSALFHISLLPSNSPLQGEACDFGQAVGPGHQMQLDGQRSSYHDGLSRNILSTVRLHNAVRRLGRCDDEDNKTRTKDDDDDNGDENSNETFSEEAFHQRNTNRLNGRLKLEVVLNANRPLSRPHGGNGVYSVQRVSTSGTVDQNIGTDLGGRLNMAFEGDRQDEVPTDVNAGLAAPNVFIVTRL